VRALIAALLLATAPAFAEEATAPDPNFAWLTGFLETNSSVDLAGTDETPREAISTRTQARIVHGALIIEYERFTYRLDAPEVLDRHQKIFYTAGLAAIDPGSIAVQQAGESAPGVPFWMVSFDVRPDPGHFPYTNIVQHYGETKTPQVFTSKGKIRQIILGYVPTAELANELAEKFRASLKAAAATTPAEVTRPDQSVA